MPEQPSSFGCGIDRPSRPAAPNAAGRQGGFRGSPLSRWRPSGHDRTDQQSRPLARAGASAQPRRRLLARCLPPSAQLARCLGMLADGVDLVSYEPMSLSVNSVRDVRIRCFDKAEDLACLFSTQ
jgi:hypothetical protein